MGDRKSERKDPGPAASRGSIRISASNASRPADTGDKDLSDSQSKKEPLDPAMARSSAMLFLVAAVGASAFAVTRFLVTQNLDDTSSVFLIVAALISWMAYGLRERGHQQIWAAAVGVTSLTALLTLNDMSVTLALAGVLVILMWSGMILRPRHNALLAAYTVVAIWVLGGTTPAQTQADPTPAASTGQGDAKQYPLPVLLTFMAVPLGLGATLHLRQRAAQSSQRKKLAKLEEERDELGRKLETQKAEIELAREQLFEAQKLKTVGTMAAGLAHELNNILTPIRGHAELIAEGDHKIEQTRRYGQRILDSAVAAAQITQALLTYAHKDTFQPVRSNLRQLLASTILPVLSKTLPGNVLLKIELDRNVSVDVDRHLFQQAIVNLVFNACDAMPTGGEITVGLTTSKEIPSEKSESSSVDKVDHDASVDRSALVTVTDTGTGIEDEHLQQIFDPFFTTKAVGSGSGLGLAMVMGTITRHHGRVDVESEVGKGTSFKVYLPLAVTDEKSDGHKPWPVLGGDSKGPVVVVVTEDQDALDEFEELLEATECAPICTNDAKGATPLLTEMGDKVDLLILDLELEATDGKRLFKSVREQFPEMPVILLSEQPTDPMVQRMIAAGPTRSVRKPMDNRLFSALLTDLLNPTDGYVRDFTPVPITPGADVSGPHPRAS